MTAGSIDEVIGSLSIMIDSFIARRSRLGFFAALYRQITRQIQVKIGEGVFDDGPRMASLDVVFANRYLAAFERWSSDADTAEAWRIAFDTAATGRVTILQDLLLATSAHINFDLGIAAAEVGGDALPGLKHDFDTINSILAAFVDAAQGVIDEFSPGMNALDAVGGRSDEALVTFSVGVARDEAWLNAEVLTARPPEARPPYVKSMDRNASLLARSVVDPGFPFDLALGAVRLLESRDVPAVVEALAGIELE